ncbi:MAG TPA: PAS domain-containing protein [Brevundimonas sp.]|uniref:PAS domain-containing protein n=1 Tax=Brevundimonas sp. TaxID=1871086 RepID=UPI0026372CF6|nr:PAS domain-containing protein [Brevundimonas sp.]HRO34324.1 PAS domain-containing protein [Brevundimonas sp.]
MFHHGTQTLIDAWNRLPDAQRIPSRVSIDPAAFGPLLPQVFVADRTEVGAKVRFAGGWVEAFHGHALSCQPWLQLWGDDSRPLVASAILQCFREARPVAVVAQAGTEGLEIAIAPLRGPDGRPSRLLGLYQPTTALARVMTDAPALSARVTIGVGDLRRAPLALACIDGRRVA